MQASGAAGRDVTPEAITYGHDYGRNLALSMK